MEIYVRCDVCGFGRYLRAVWRSGARLMLISPSECPKCRSDVNSVCPSPAVEAMEAMAHRASETQDVRVKVDGVEQ